MISDEIFDQGFRNATHHGMHIMINYCVLIMPAAYEMVRGFQVWFSEEESWKRFSSKSLYDQDQSSGSAPYPTGGGQVFG